MKLTVIMILICVVQLKAAVYGQRIVYKANNISLPTLFKEITKRTGFTFAFNPNDLTDQPNINIAIDDATINEVLNKCLLNKPFEYVILDQTIVIKRKPDVGKVNIQLRNPGRFVAIRVSNISGKAMPGVSIKIYKDNLVIQEQSTTEQGITSIQLPSPEESITVQFSYIGYESQRINAKDLKDINQIVLKESMSSLDQVQILAYGTTTKRLNTGSVTTITAADIAKNPVQNVLQAIEGRVPGLFIQQNTGTPGGSFKVDIRGGSSMGSGTPLFIVDGVTFPAGGTLPLLSSYLDNSIGGDSGTGFLRGGNALNYLNTNDIESVTVLKDADATSAYGSRGAFGVIIITTKKGHSGPGVFNANVYSGISMRGSFPQLLSLDEYLMIRRESKKNDGTTPGPSEVDINGTWPTDRSTDWQRLFTGNKASTTNVNLGYSGGSALSTYRLSGNYAQQKSIQLGSGDAKNGGLAFNLGTYTENKKFHVDLSGSFSYDVNTLSPYDLSGGLGAVKAPNAPPVFNPDGSLNWETGSNEFAGINSLSNLTTNNLVSTLALVYNPIKKLTLNFTGGFNLINGREFRAQPLAYFNPNVDHSRDVNSDLNTYSITTVNFDANVNYVTNLGAKGKLDARLAGTLQSVVNNSLSVHGQNFASDAQVNNPAIATTVTTSANSVPSRVLGYLGHVNYTWDEKYVLNLNGRYDGSTKFGPNNRWGFFGSAGAAWIVSEEKWFKNNISFVSFLKLRGSYGTVGGDDISNYNYLANYASSNLNYLGKTILNPINLENPDLHWSTKKESELGLSFELLNGRVSFDGNYYLTRSSEQLAFTTTPSITGFTGYTVNAPTLIQTNGYEFTISSVNIHSKDFMWKSSFNLSIPKSKLLKYEGADLNKFENLRIGQPITGVKVYKYVGVNPETGLYNYVNHLGETGDFFAFSGKTLDQNLDRTEFIDKAPKYYGGFGNTFTYKNLSLDIFIDFKSRMGKNILGSLLFPPGVSIYNTSSYVLNRWQKPGDISDVAQISGYGLFYYQDFQKSSGAYSRVISARLNNANLSYSFPANTLKKYHLKGLSVYLRGQNLLTVSNLHYKGLDPENFSVATTPPLRTFTAGLNVSL